MEPRTSSQDGRGTEREGPPDAVPPPAQPRAYVLAEYGGEPLAEFPGAPYWRQAILTRRTAGGTLPAYASRLVRK